MMPKQWFSHKCCEHKLCLCRHGDYSVTYTVTTVNLHGDYIVTSWQLQCTYMVTKDYNPIRVCAYSKY